jgi:tetratricopeptide (TPR) repeat protein
MDIKRASVFQAFMKRFEQAEALMERGNHRDAIEELTAAIGFCNEINSSCSAAVCESRRGFALKELGRFPEALGCFERALAVLPRCGPQFQGEAARCANHAGRTLEALGRYREALPLYVEAYDAMTRLGRYAEAAIADLNVGNMLLLLGRPREAIEHLQRARRVFVTNHEALMAAQCDNALAGARLQLGELDAGLTDIERALAAFQKLNREIEAAHCTSTKALLMYARGAHKETLSLIRSAKAVYARHGLRLDTAFADISEGNAQSMLGQYESAIESYARARQIVSQHGLIVEAAICDMNGGVLEKVLGRFEQAIALLDRARTELHGQGHELFAAGADLECAGAFLPLNASDEAAQRYTRARDVFRAKGLELNAIECDLALMGLDPTTPATNVLEALEKAARGRRESGDHVRAAVCLANRALKLKEIGRFREARDQYAEARAIFAARGVDFQTARCDTDAGWTCLDARAAAADGGVDGGVDDLTAARQLFDSALGIFERLRGSLVSPDNRASFFDRCTLAYKGATLVRLAAGQHAEALACLERSRARVLAETLNADVHPDPADIGQDFYDEFLELRGRSTAADLALALRNRVNTPAAHRVADPGAKPNDFTAWIDRVTHARPDSRFVRAFASTTPVVLDSVEEYHDLLPDDRSCIVVFIAWSLDDRLRALLISKQEGLRLVTFPKGSMLALARVWEEWNAIYASGSVKANIKLVTATCVALHEHIFGAEVTWDGESRRFVDELTRLTHATTEHPGRLYIVPHLFLSMLPLHAACVANDGKPEDYLLSKFIISFAPTATLLKLSKRPVSPMSDEPSAMMVGNPHHSKSASLDGAEEEVRALGSLLRGAGWAVDDVYGSAATKARFLGEAGSPGAGLRGDRYSHLHLAQHAGFQQSYTRFAQTLIFSDANGQTNDRCDASEIAAVPLQRLRSVVAAVCSGSVNHPWLNEPTGLTASFMKAGARTVVSSLFPVSDDGSRSTMELLYKRRFEEGLSWADALRRAQVDMSRHSDLAAPYYWASFIHSGDDEAR